MVRRALLLTCFSCTMFVAGANAGIIANLDATAHGQAAPFGSNPLNISLLAGTYAVTPVGIAGGGIFDAWSPWPSNLNCLADHTCERGWETSFDYSYAGGYFNVASGAWDTPAEALAHAVSATFTLAVPETVSFGFNECAGCLGDNRGGNSLEIVTPEPASGAVLILGLAALAGRSRRRSAR